MNLDANDLLGFGLGDGSNTKSFGSIDLVHCGLDLRGLRFMSTTIDSMTTIKESSQEELTRKQKYGPSGRARYR
jgi:hypothetical protein